MANNNYATFLIKADTSENWEANNPRLRSAELVADLSSKKLKLGNGRSLYNNLPYLYHDVYDMVKALVGLLCNINDDSDNSTILYPVESLEALAIKYPTSNTGDIVFVKDIKALYYYNGSEWVKCIYNRINEPDYVYRKKDLATKYANAKVGTLVYCIEDCHYYTYTQLQQWNKLSNSSDTYEPVNTQTDLANLAEEGSTPTTGQLVYVKAEDEFYYWNGTNWSMLNR